MKKLLIILICEIIPLTTNTLELPTNIVLHLDKRYPNYVETLQPWNSYPASKRANLSTLTYVIGVFRHGNKPPTDTYEGDKYPYYDEKYWPNGFSQLTKVGKKQLQSLGKILRMRYDGFLSEIYKSEEILVKGNYLDRVYMSATCLLAGLYPPFGKDLSQEQLQSEWQVVPVWEQQHDMSKVAKDPSVCPRFYKMELEAEEIINKYTYQYQDLIDFLSNCTAMGVTKLRDVFKYWNLVYFQEQEGYPRPLWASNGTMEVLTNLASSTFTALLSTNKEMSKLIAGPLIKEFATELRMKISGRPSDISRRKMHLEGGHGTTLNGLLPALGFKEPFVPHVGSVFLVELHRFHKGNYIQALYISNCSTGDVELLEIPECGYECPLDQMMERIAEVTPSNWAAECELSHGRCQGCSSYANIMLSVLLSFVSLYCCKHKSIIP